MSMVLQKMQVASILRRHDTIGEGFFRLEILLGLLPLSLVDMLHVINGSFGTWWFPFLPMVHLLRVFLFAWTPIHTLCWALPS